MSILILGGTGAMGVHVSNLLADAGHDVYVTSRSTRENDDGITYVRGNAKETGFLKALLAKHWDTIVDFMIWSTSEFSERVSDYLNATDQYVFVSSYRVYADSPVITEESPRLLDVVEDPEYLATDEYALCKARCEDILFNSGRTNWTVVRPAVTYDSGGRFQLAVHESGTWLWRAINDIPVPLPAPMLEKQGTMTWGGDVARMITGLVGNSRALGEAFTVSTSEHKTWRQIAETYRSIVPQLQVVSCDLAAFEKARGGVYQIRYDRMFDRVIDNSKILTIANMEQSSLKTIEDGLTSELKRYLATASQLKFDGAGLQAHLDSLLGGCPSMMPIFNNQGPVAAAKYFVRRVVG